MKRCSKCREEKDFSQFHKNRAQPDGYQNQCYPCWYKIAKKYRKTPAGKASIARQKARPEYRESQLKYARSEKGKQRQREKYLRIKDTPEEKRRNVKRMKKCRKMYPQEYRAYDAVKQAVRAGKIPKVTSLQCDRCNKNARKYHHHLGYTEEHKLDVIPLCKACHIREHHPEAG